MNREQLAEELDREIDALMQTNASSKPAASGCFFR